MSIYVNAEIVMTEVGGFGCKCSSPEIQRTDHKKKVNRCIGDVLEK